MEESLQRIWAVICHHSTCRNFVKVEAESKHHAFRYAERRLKWLYVPRLKGAFCPEHKHLNKEYRA